MPTRCSAICRTRSRARAPNGPRPPSAEPGAWLLVFAPRAFQDVERLTAFLIESDPDAAVVTASLLFGGLRILKEHPLVGRLAEHGYRELLISRGRTGYMALYRYDVERDVALVLAVRHQRESGFDNS